MLCEQCGEREAIVALTHIDENEKTHVHLCGECAREQGIDVEASLEELEERMSEQEERDEQELRCSSCGMTYDRFKEHYRLGCAECYSSFREELRPLLRKVHGAHEHVGKRPSPAAEVREAAAETTEGKDAVWTLDLLQRRLRGAVEREEFEEAARLRDRIDELKKRQETEEQA